MARSNLGLWLGLAVAVVGCKDPTVGPPPRKLAEDQAQKVAARLLKQRPSPMRPADVTFGGGKVRFLGSDLRPEPVGRGQTLRLTHYFESLAPLSANWKLFVHVESASRPGILVNADHVPVEGLYPTDRWQPGQIIQDDYSITVPAAAPEELVVSIGFYRFDERLPLDDRAWHDGANRVPAVRVRVAGEDALLPTVKAGRRKGEIVIDGELDDPGWKGAGSTGPFLRSHDGAQPRYRTEAKLAWDDEFLYVAWSVEDEDVWARLEKKDDPIYGEEAVEIFIDADGDGRTYNEIELSPANVQFDAYFPARRQGMDLSWDSKAVSAVKVRGTLNDPSDRDEGWTAELKIPVKGLAAVPRWPPQPQDRWRINLYRLEWHSGRKVNEGSAFSPPLVGDFHHLPRFGILELAP